MVSGRCRARQWKRPGMPHQRTGRSRLSLRQTGAIGQGIRLLWTQSEHVRNIATGKLDDDAPDCHYLIRVVPLSGATKLVKKTCLPPARADEVRRSAEPQRCRAATCRCRFPSRLPAGDAPDWQNRLMRPRSALGRKLSDRMVCVWIQGSCCRMAPSLTSGALRGVPQDAQMLISSLLYGFCSCLPSGSCPAPDPGRWAARLVPCGIRP